MYKRRVQARPLAGRGAAVALAVRNLGAGEAAAQRIRATHPAALVDVLHLDLSDQDSVREAAHELASRAADAGRGLDPVSYTHLTLPTSDLV